jgi:hypothetical protein
LPKIGINEQTAKLRTNEILKEPKVHLQPLLHITAPQVPPSDPMLGTHKVRLEPLQTQVLASTDTTAVAVVTTPLHEPISPSKAVSLPTEDPTSGIVTIIYEMYSEQFPIAQGTISSEAIDEVYGLSDIMPNCSLHLSFSSPAQIREKIIAATAATSCPLSALPLGSLGYPEWYFPFDDKTKTHQSLEVGGTYFCYVREPGSEREWQSGDGSQAQPSGESRADDGRGFDCCTCIYGTPCQV